jgi:hypothetical protein
MKKSIAQLHAGFESSTGLTPEFNEFYKTFKREFTKELKSQGATDIKFSRGHFFISGFCTIDGQIYYFSLPDVRSSNFRIPKLLYRTAESYKDFTGGMNRYAEIKTGMGEEMFWSFKVF